MHWKPAIRWVIDRIRVLRPIRFETIRRNEVSGKAPYATLRRAAQGEADVPHLVVEDDRQQRAALVLRDVAYVIDAHFEMTSRAGPIGHTRPSTSRWLADASRVASAPGNRAWERGSSQPFSVLLTRRT